MKTMQSSIFVRDLRLYAYHGVMEQERTVGGWFIVSLRVHYNIVRAMETDDVNDTLSYADLCELVRQEMELPSNLLEHVAGRIANAILDRYPLVEAVDLTLTKENPPMGVNCNGAGVELHLINNKTTD
jgi:dihydroneopterin aldolase